MQEIKFNVKNQTPVLSEQEIREDMAKFSEILDEVKEGEAKYQESLGWHHVDEWCSDAWLKRYEDLAKEVQEKADVLVVIGIGGSNQAARAVVDSIGEKSSVKIVWAGNTISAYEINAALKEIEGKNVYVNVIAKNFETLEPGIAFRAFRAKLKEQYGDGYAKHFICTGTEGSHLEELCKRHGYTFLPFPKDIGGRFTAMSPVGLFPLSVAGLDIRSMAAGAKHMEERLKAETPEENMALRYAVMRNLLYRKGYRMEMLCFFEPRLFRFAKWWMQLFGESEGKDNLGLYPSWGNYSEDLHSIGQFVQEGTPMLYETFIDVTKQDSSLILEKQDVNDHFDYLDGMDFYEVNKAAYEATLSAHSNRFPCGVLTIPALDEETFGQMFYFFEFACYLSGRILGVNPFDQPGVEDYKQRMFRILGKN